MKTDERKVNANMPQNSKKKGNKSFAVSRVVRKLFSVSLMFLDSPKIHLSGADKDKKPGRPNGINHDGKRDPGADFKKIVGTRNELEQEAFRNGPHCASLRS